MPDSMIDRTHRYSVKTGFAIACAALGFTLLTMVGPPSALAYNGVPDDLSDFRWSGTVSIGWSHTTYDEIGVWDGSQEAGELRFDEIQPMQGSANGDYIADDLTVPSWEMKEWSDSCGTYRLDHEWGLAYMDRYFTVPGADFQLRSQADGFYFGPANGYYLTNPTGQSFECDGDAVPITPPTTPYAVLTAVPALTTPAVKLNQDSDPDPYHLVGSSTWGLNDSPWVLHDDVTSFGFAVNYDLRLVAAEPPACSDGVSNDLDGLSDYPLDPGCSSAADISELGTTACDNGKDDDGDGRADFPADGDCGSPLGAYEQFDCRASGKKQKADLKYDGRVALNNLPDAHLFRFEPTLIYCFGAGRSEIFSANTYGFVDAGVDAAALEALGFTTEYTGGNSIKSGSLATFDGEFVALFDSLSIGKRLPVRKVLKKGLGGKFRKQMTKALAKHRSSAAAKQLVRKESKNIRLKIVAQYGALADRVIGKSPGPIRPFVTKLVRRLETKLDRYLKREFKKKVDNILNTRKAGEWTSEELADVMISAVEGIFDKAFEFEFPLWQPKVAVETHPDGHLSQKRDGFTNPFLAIEYGEQLTALP